MMRDSKREISLTLTSGTCKNTYVENLHFQIPFVPENQGFKNLVRILDDGDLNSFYSYGNGFSLYMQFIY